MSRSGERDGDGDAAIEGLWTPLADGPRAGPGVRNEAWRAAVAQPVERVLGKDEVTGSNPVSSSIQ